MRITHSEIAKAYFSSALFRQSILDCKEFKLIQVFKRQNEDQIQFGGEQNTKGYHPDMILQDKLSAINVFQSIPEDCRNKVKFGLYGENIE